MRTLLFFLSISFVSCSDICDILADFGIDCPTEATPNNEFVFTTGTAPDEASFESEIGFDVTDFESDGTTITFENANYSLSKNFAFRNSSLVSIHSAANKITCVSCFSELTGVTKLSFPNLEIMNSRAAFEKLEKAAIEDFHFPKLRWITGSQNFRRWNTDLTKGSTLDSLSLPSLVAIEGSTNFAEIDASSSLGVVLSAPSLKYIKGQANFFYLQDVSIVSAGSLESISGASNFSDYPYVVLFDMPKLSEITQEFADFRNLALFNRLTTLKLNVRVSKALENYLGTGVQEDIKRLIDNYDADVEFVL